MATVVVADGSNHAVSFVIENNRTQVQLVKSAVNSGNPKFLLAKVLDVSRRLIQAKGTLLV